ncbi:MAG: hypothetical protein RL404_487 [Pseudomonadota bacterium]|jgi:DNA-binding CsgD family transcriptional regulator/PAS domain-containing protein
MTLPLDLSMRLNRAFYEGLARPQRFAEGLRLMAESLDSELAVFGLWDRRGLWAVWRQARKAGDCAWQYLVEDNRLPSAEFRAHIRKLPSSRWALAEPLDLPISFGRLTDHSLHALCRRLTVGRADALLCLYRHDASLPGPGLLMAADDMLSALRPGLEPLARMQQLAQGSRYLTHLLSCIRMPVMLVDASGRILAANPSARSMVDQARKTNGGKPGVAIPGLSADQFAAIVRRACRPGDKGGSSLMQVSPGSAQQPLQVMATPVAANPAIGSNQPTALILVHGSQGVESGSHLLQQIFGLTPAEARLTRLILEGRSPGDAAIQLHVSVATIRTQLSAVLKKTGAQRQSDLVRRLSPLLVLDSGQQLH